MHCYSDTIQSFLPAGVAVSPGVGPSDSSPYSGLPVEFNSSISKDIEGVKGVSAGLDHTEVRQFLDVLERCEGQMLFSGVGELVFSYL